MKPNDLAPSAFTRDLLGRAGTKINDAGAITVKTNNQM